jgi:DNA-binding response OmpR family regulator
MRKLKVLIASAGPGSGNVTKAALEYWGCAVTMASDGKQACAALMAGHVDLCILDWELPKMTALESCKWMRSVDLKSQPHVVLMTETNHPEQIEAAYLAGANDYIAKPLNLEDLHFLISAFAQKISQKDVVSLELTHMDPLDMYRRDLTPRKAHSRP